MNTTTTRLICAAASLVLTVALFDSVSSLAGNAHTDLQAQAPAAQTPLLASTTVVAPV